MRVRERVATAVLAMGVLLLGSACRDGTKESSSAPSTTALLSPSSGSPLPSSSSTTGATTTTSATTTTPSTTAPSVAVDTTAVDITDPTEPTTAATEPPATTTTLEAPTGELPTTAPSTTAAPTLPTGTDPACVTGTWTMATDALQALTPKLLPSVPAHLLTGALRLETTSDGRFSYTSSALLVRIDSAGGYLEGSGDFARTGRWTAASGTATVTTATATGGITTWYAVSGDQRALIPRAPTPLTYDLPASGAFLCDTGLLSFTATASDGTPVPMIFTRTP